MNYILITRNTLGKGILAIMNDDEEIAQFETEEEAEACADQQPLCQAWGYQVVELEL
jgi:hypothetical protein